MAISDSKRWDEVQKLFEQALELDIIKKKFYRKNFLQLIGKFLTLKVYLENVILKERDTKILK